MTSSNRPAPVIYRTGKKWEPKLDDRVLDDPGWVNELSGSYPSDQDLDWTSGELGKTVPSLRPAHNPLLDCLHALWKFKMQVDLMVPVDSIWKDHVIAQLVSQDLSLLPWCFYQTGLPST